MGNYLSLQKKQQHKRHYASSNPPKRHSSPAVPSEVFFTPSYLPPSTPSTASPYLARGMPGPPLSPTPDGQQVAEITPLRMPSPQSIGRTLSHGGHIVPRLAGTEHVRMPIVPATVEEVPPMPMPMPERAPHIQFPVPTLGTARAEPLTRRNSKEDPLIMLQKYDTVIIVDDSGSMAGALWNEASEALSGIATLAGRYDSDGIDIYFLNSPSVGRNLANASDVKRLFDSVRPEGHTPIGARLEELLLDYLLRLEQTLIDPRAPGVKPVNFIVITDGAPTDDPESVIITAARRLDKNNFPLSQVGIQFVQIGTDPDATEALRGLDDELSGKHDIRDMVDTTPYTGQQLTTETVTKILLGGVNRRVDRRGHV